MNLQRAFPFVLVFMAVVSVSSLWSLYAFRSASFMLVFSVAASYFLLKKFSVELDASTPALLMCIGIAFLAAYPYLFITPFVDASADPASHISSLAIGDTLPETYAPFSGLEYRYQIGFPLLAKTFIGLFPFVSSNTIVWFFGVMFAFFSAILVYFLAKEMFGGEKAGLLALALFVGSKIVFQNMYWGQYPFMMASVFFLATFLAFYRKSKMAYLFFPVIFMAHPGVAFYSILFFALWGLVFKDFFGAAKLLFSGVLVLPVFFISYVHFLSNAGAEEVVPLALGGLAANAMIFPLWVGALVFVLALFSVARIFLEKDFTRLNVLLISSFGVSAFLALFLNTIGSVLGGRVIELAMFSGLFLAVSLVSGRLPELVHGKFALDNRKAFAPVFLLILVVSLGLFFSSSQLNHLRSGSKISAEEIGFAYAFKNFDPEYKKTLFLVDNHAKIAEVSQKIPFDVMSNWYLSYHPRIAGNDPFFAAVEARHALAERVREENCVECMLQILGGSEIDYVVAKKDFFSRELGLKKVFEHPPYMVFSGA